MYCDIVSPGNKNKNRYSIGNSAAAMLESDAMVRLGIRSVLGSTGGILLHWCFQ